MKILSLDPFVTEGGTCPSCTGGLGMVYSLDPFAHSPRGLGMVYSLDPFAHSPRGLGALGIDAAAQSRTDKIVQGIVAKGDNCNDYLKWADTYTRLSNKDKKKSTLEGARELAALYQQKYSECVEKKATAAVQLATGAVMVPTPVTIPATQNVPQQYAVPQTQVSTGSAVTSQQPAPSGWMTPKTLLMIGGGVLAVGLVVYLMRRK
jgi:hypothetical protein